MVSLVVFAMLFVMRKPLERAIRPMLFSYYFNNLSKAEREEVMKRAVQEVDLFQEDLIARTLSKMPTEEKKKIYQKLANQIGSWNDTLPEPNVGRILKKNHQFTFKKAVVQTNNAGLRSQRPFTKKSNDVFRIICLGDSMVFGTGGKEEDRFCDQIEDYYPFFFSRQ